MSNFVVSARKYRPSRFEDVVGQQHVSQTLKNALQSDHLAHAFLFCGPRGVGKTTCARILAKVLNCQNITSDFEACNECDSCKAFNANASFNITELDAASNNSVEHIRALIEQVRFQPQQGKYKVFIIDEVHMLSQQAFNAFLKTLEEPPPYAIFILATTEKHKIIPTILSRCQIFDFRRIQVPDMVGHLEGICRQEGIEAEQDALHIIGQKADGALRDALSIFDRIVAFSGKRITYEDVISNLNILDYDFFFKMVDALMVEDAAGVMMIFDDIQRRGFEPDLFVNGLAEHLRNLLVCKDEVTLQLLEVSEGLRDRYQQQARLAPARFLLTALNLANDCDVNYKLARNKRLHVEMALLKMAYINRAFQLAENGAPAAVPEKKTAELTQRAPKTPSAPEVATAAPEKEPENTPPPPAPEPKPKEIVKSRKHEAPRLDMNALLEEVKAETAQSESQAETVLTLGQVQAAWEEYTEALEQESVKVILRNAGLELDGKKLTAKVSSALAENTIRQESALMEYLRTQLNSPQLGLFIEIDKSKAVEAPKPKRILGAKEKYLAMRETNPLIQEMQQRFDLRPDE
ncbi:MAG: DNA polymerase III subunit gamma/tau [Phaeodactylibacter sp.]|nr:DNA polymerase III subunit gamma/tau [Phaeodactylibacter sp.]MCB9276702.1 DNA polymerase III subunit gamma/tau [Lewinellaceae bacterium]